MKIDKNFGNKIYIEWIDAYSTDGWTSYTDVFKESLNAFCKTNAFYVGETENFIIVSHTQGSTKDNSLMGVLHIPKKWVRKIK